MFFFRKYVVFCLSAFAHTWVQAGRGIYDCGHDSVTTARSARSTNRYKTPGKTKPESKLVIFFVAREFDGFHTLSLLVDSKVTLGSC